MRRWVVLLLFFLGTAWLWHPGIASPAFQVTPDPVEYTFGGQITLRASLDTQIKVVAVQAFLRGSGDTETYSGPAIIQDGEVVFLHDLTSQPLRAFSDVEYWFRISPENGEPFQSDTYTFYYEDNRFSWQTLSSGPFSVHWYEGTTEFAQSVLHAAVAGLERAKTLLKLPLVQAVDIYVYASGMEMQSTLRLGGLRWIAGHADPDLGVAVVSLPPGPDQASETARQIPHEVMHLLLYQLTGASYYSLPIWLKEGLASANETRPNPDYYVILSSAVEKDTLIPMASLCQTFPQDTTVYQAYAQSDSFVRFLHQQYGQAGIQDLVNSYAAGQGCENGSQAVTGLSLSGLDQEWRETRLNDNVLGVALEALLPWSGLLLAIVLVPLVLVLTSLRKSPRPHPAGHPQ